MAAKKIKSPRKKKTINFCFSDYHKEYILACQNNTYNIAEGAVRAGKTIDNVFAFAHELKTTPDKIHLATGSTMGNAKLNIGDANGFGLEWIFRGQCRWGKYKDMDALIIKGPATQFRQKIVIFSGAAASDSYKKIRGNSYGMWIATEINLHHDNTIKEAFNRQLAAKRRKIFWDLNPEHPKADIYVNYIDRYAEKAKLGELLGGYNYRHFTIFQNVNISKERIDEICSQYEPGSIWYIRDIEGKRSIAQGLIYSRLATSIAADDAAFFISKKDAVKMADAGLFLKINVGVDFGGSGSGHAFVASAITQGYRELIILKSERHVEGDIDPDTGKRVEDIDPEQLASMFVRFCESILDDFGFITKVYADSAEQVLIRGLRNALLRKGIVSFKVSNAAKTLINDRIFAMTSLCAQRRVKYTEDCKTFTEAVSMAVWDPSKIEYVRLDDGTSDIDTLDACEYTYENDISKMLKDFRQGG